MPTCHNLNFARAVFLPALRALHQTYHQYNTCTCISQDDILKFSCRTSLAKNHHFLRRTQHVKEYCIGTLTNILTKKGLEGGEAVLEDMGFGLWDMGEQES